ncbi:MAG TPA: hypothetical protein G4N95_09190 [Anaerolineae bacterium]|nr:hypothetical protein [Anaerolineae bacterium]
MKKNKIILVVAVMMVFATILSACALLTQVSGIITKKVASSISNADLKPEDVQIAMNDLVLRPDDLPDEYRIPPSGESRYANLAVINERGELQGKKYIVATGRVDGWRINLVRSNKEDIAPSYFESTIEVFETSEGAALAISPDWYKAYLTEGEPPTLEDGCNIGNACLLYHSSKHDPATNLTTVRYEVAFTYRNLLVWVMGRGLDVDVTPDYVLNAAQTVYDKIVQYESGSK